MNSDPFTGHWTSVDSGRSSAAVFSNQSLAGQDAGVRDPRGRRLDHLSSELDLNNATMAGHDDPTLKQWLPTMQDLFSPSNSSGSGDNFGISPENSDQQAPKLFRSQPDDFENQMLQIKLNGNSLKRQNKQLKERCQHYQRLNDQMRHQMKTDSSGFYQKLHESLIGKIISAKQRQMESSREDLQEHLLRLQKEVEHLRGQNAALEKELDVSRDTEWQTALPNKESGLQISSAYKEELSRIRQLFESSEEKRRRDLERWRDDLQQMDILKQLANKLHKELQQAEEHNASQKLVAATEQRLRQVEQSLQRERQDRATGLSSVEERLLMENAKLQITEKEAQRHSNQTLNRLKCLESRYLEAKKLLESHDLETLDDLSAVYKSGASTTNVLDKVLDRHPSRRSEMTTDDEMDKRLRDALQQITDMETVFRQRSHELLMEKNETSAQLQNLQDINEALKTENQSLRSSLASSSRDSKLSSTNSFEAQTHRDQVKVLESELKAAVDQIGRLSEANQHADALLKKLEEISIAGESPLGPERLQQTIRTPFLSPKRSRRQDNEPPSPPPLPAERASFGRHRLPLHDDDEKHSQYTDLLLHLMRSKMATTEAEFLHLDESEHLTLEGALEEKDSQLLKLNLECDELRTELDFAKKSVNHQTENNERLQQQVEQLRSQLRQQSRLVESLSMTEQDLQMELNTVKQRLTVMNKELLDKEAEVKSVQLLRDVMMRGSGQPEKTTPSWKEMGSSSETTTDAKTDELDFDDRITLAKLSATLVQLQFEKQNVDDSLQKANTTIEMMVRENAELKHRLQQFHQQLSNERSMVCRLTYDKMAAQQQFYAVDEECDGLRRMKERLEVEVIRQETNSLRLSTLLDLHRQQTSHKLDARFNKVNGDLKRTSAELRSTKQLLSTREKDILLLQNTVELMLKYDEASSVH